MAATALTWHWSPNNGFALNHEIRGWNECLITYVLAASSPRYAIAAEAYHDGWAQGREFLNRRSFEGVELPLGPDWGGPLFFAHFSFCGIDPRGLERSLMPTTGGRTSITPASTTPTASAIPTATKDTGRIAGV